LEIRTLAQTFPLVHLSPKITPPKPSSILTTKNSVACPLLVIFTANAYTLWNEHWEHEAHAPPASERPQYDYLNIRNKAYPWGDGTKTIFWNEKVNYIKEE
jgi:hypothetical protein